MTYKLDSYSIEMYQMRENELSTSRLSKGIVWQTDKQTDMTEIVYHAALRVVNKEHGR